MKTFFINNLRNNKDLQKSISNNPGVYKWWCKESLLVRILNKLELPLDETIVDIEMKVLQNFNLQYEHTCANDMYYCVYVGDTKTLRKRIVNQHLNGNVKGSTFRKTIAAVFVGSEDKNSINEIQNQMIIEIEDYDISTFHDIQNQVINEWFRPLNNDDIFGDNNLYSEARHYFSSTNTNMKKSKMITELRRNL